MEIVGNHAVFPLKYCTEPVCLQNGGLSFWKFVLQKCKQLNILLKLKTKFINVYI